MILALLLSGAVEAHSSVYGTAILPVGFDCSRAVFANAVPRPDTSEEVALIGTVVKIFQAGDVRRNWAVVVHVDRVVSGKFSYKTYTFILHSPSRAGLFVGQTYRINARWAGRGYVLDEFTLRSVRRRNSGLTHSLHLTAHAPR
jgi:hypothetical protein